jgi:hypothetical protein
MSEGLRGPGVREASRPGGAASSAEPAVQAGPPLRLALGRHETRLLPVTDIHQRADEADSLLDGVPFESTAPQIPGWDRPAWAVRGVKEGPELIWQREASVDVTYTDGGVEDTLAPELVRTDQVTIDEAGAAVHVGETVIHFAADAYITPGEARKLAEALAELADYAEACDDRRICRGGSQASNTRRCGPRRSGHVHPHGERAWERPVWGSPDA